MQAIIHIEVGSGPGNQYNHPIMQWGKEKFPELVTFDLDNFSEPAIINYAIDLIEHIDKVLVIMEAREGANAGPLLKFMEKLISSKSKKEILLLLNGKNPLLEKMGKVLGTDSFLRDKDLPAQKQLLKTHFT